MTDVLKKTTYTGVFTAIIFVLTMFVKIAVPSGYIHLGDSVIYVFALLVGSPWAAIAGALGEGLADIAGGYAIYLPATVIIKTAIAVLFSVCRKGNRLLNKKTVFMTVPAGIITVAGYFAADLLIDKAYAYVDIPGNIIQAASSAVAFVIIAAMFDRADIKKYFL